MARGIARAVSFGGRATAGCCSYRRVTVAVCLGNLVAALLVLRSLVAPASFAPTAPKRVEVEQYTEEQIRRVEESIRIRRAAEPVELVQAVKKLRKVFAREEKRRKELPLVLKQKVSYDIVRRLRDLGNNGTIAQQRANAVANYMTTIEPLNGTNYPTWREKVLVMLSVMEYDYALRVPLPQPPAAGGEDFADRQREYIDNTMKWEKSNRMALMLIKSSISVAIRGAIIDKRADGSEMNVMEFLQSIEENFKSSSKTYASTLIMKMLTSRYDGQSGIREHIMNMCDMAAKLKALEMSISDGFLVHFIMTSLPAQYSPFKISYNTQKGTWNVAELISYCVEEEERQKAEKMKDMANVVNFGKGKNQAESSSSKQHNKRFKPNKNDKGKNPQKPHQKNMKKGLVCSFCQSPKHLQKECAGFKEWLQKKGIPFNENYKKGGAKP